MAKRQHGTGSVYRRANGLWIGTIEAGWTPRGTRRRVTVSAKTEAACKRKLKERQREIAREGTPEAGSVRATVRTWSTEWLEQRATKARPKYYADDASAIRRWIVPTIGQRRLTDLGPQDVRAVTNALRSAGRSTTTAKYVHGVLLRMLKDARMEGHRIPERALTVPAPGKASNDRDAIPASDVGRLLAAAADHPDRTRWAIALLLGLRQGECLGLTWDAVDLAAGTLHVSWQLQALPYLDRDAGTFRVPDGYESRRLVGAYHLVRPKSKAGWRVVPLAGLSQDLAAWRSVAPDSPHGLVWPRVNGSPRSDKQDRAAWHDLQAAAGVAHPSGRPYHLHEARHAAATRLLELGTDPHVITAIMGHSSIVTTRGYQHVSVDLARQAVAAAQTRGLPAGSSGS